MRHFDRGERLDHHLRVPLLQPAKHVRVVRQLQLGMQAAHDVKLARGIFARRAGFGEDFLQAAGVGAVFLRHARERAEHAGIAQDADVGRIDVLVRRKVDTAAVTPLIGEVREPADGEEVGRSKKREAILAREPFAVFDLVRNRSQVHATLRTAINNAEGQKQQVIKASEAKRQQQINEAQGQAEAILAIANATSEGIRLVSQAIATPGGQEAVQLRVAEQYVKEFGALAKASNTVILPATVS